MIISRRGLAASGAALLAAPAILRPARAQGTLEFVAGGLGGGWYTMATGCSQLVQEANPGISLRVVPGGGLGNPTRIQNGVSQIGFGLDFLVSSAIKGETPYQAKHDKVTHFGVGYSPTEHNLMRAVGTGPSDLKGLLTNPALRIGCPQRSSSDTLALEYVLAFYGTSLDKIRSTGRVVSGSYNDIAAAYGDGQVDVMYVALAKPAAMIQEVGRGRRQTALMGFPQDLRDHMTQKYGFSQGIIQAGTYQGMHDADVPVTTMDTVIMAANSVPDDTAYRFVRTLIAAKDRLGTIHPSMAAFTPAVGCKYPGAPLHPGAAKAFAEAGCTA